MTWSGGGGVREGGVVTWSGGGGGRGGVVTWSRGGGRCCDLVHGRPPPPPPSLQTNACENITFATRVVISKEIDK